MNSFNIDDPRLTAFALGELQGNDALELEQALASDPALADDVRSIRETAGQLQAGFAAEPALGLTPPQRDLITQRAAPDVLNSPLVFRPRLAWAALGMAAAACLVLAVFVTDFGRDLQVTFERAEPARVGQAAQENVEASSATDDAGESKNEEMEVRRRGFAASPGGKAREGRTQADTLGLPLREVERETKAGYRDQAAHVKLGQLPAPPPAPASDPAPAQSTATHSPPAAASPGEAAVLVIEPATERQDSSSDTRSGETGPANPAVQRPAAVPMAPAAGARGRGGEGGADEADGSSLRSAASPHEVEFGWQAGVQVGEDREFDKSESGKRPSAKDALRLGFLDTNGDGNADAAHFFGPEVATIEQSAGSYGTTLTPPIEVRVRVLRDSINSIDHEFQRGKEMSEPMRLKRRLLAHELARCEDELRARAAGEQYNLIVDNPFIRPVGTDALSTFSIDVDTASYANVRRFIVDQHVLPPKDAVRIEELINAFDYDYEAPSGEAPFSTQVEVNIAPWKPQHRLVKIGLRGRDIQPENRPATNLVFLIDISGSMNQPNKLPLVKQSLKALVDALHGDDRLAIVTYAGNAGLAMNSLYVNAENKPGIIQMIDALSAGGSTNGAGGIHIAYQVAKEFFIKGGVNRVILCTDGDFNVGVSNQNDLIRLIEEQRTGGVFLSVLGFGTGNIQDGKMEQLANHGNGAFAYIDSIEEGRRVLVEKMAGTLITIAKDVKIQVEFNPARVQAYRLIGYENRVMAAQDFNDDRKDAGEIGAGHTVTALYEIVPTGVPFDPPPVDVLRYQAVEEAAEPAAETQPPLNHPATTELLTVKLRYKQPDSMEGAEDDRSTKIEMPVSDPGEVKFEQASADYQFAAAVAGFGMILRDSPHKGKANYDMVLDLAAAGMSETHAVHREAFIRLVELAKVLAGS